MVERRLVACCNSTQLLKVGHSISVLMMMMVYYCLAKSKPLLNTHTFTRVESELNTSSAALWSVGRCETIQRNSNDISTKPPCTTCHVYRVHGGKYGCVLNAVAAVVAEQYTEIRARPSPPFPNLNGIWKKTLGPSNAEFLRKFMHIRYFCYFQQLSANKLFALAVANGFRSNCFRHSFSKNDPRYIKLVYEDASRGSSRGGAEDRVLKLNILDDRESHT